MRFDLESLEPRELFSAGPKVDSFRVSPRSPSASTGSLQFIVTYEDSSGLDPTSFDDRDLRIAGPNDFARYARATTSTSNSTGTIRSVRYKLSPPGGKWDAGDDGRYTVRLHGDEVFDTQGDASSPSELGTFTVDISTHRGAAVTTRKKLFSSATIVSDRDQLAELG